MFVRQCDLCKKEVAIERDVTKIFIGYHLPLGQRRASSHGDVITGIFTGLDPMPVDLCHDCAKKNHDLCIEIAETNGIDTLGGD